ncbi:hypothetical protein OZN62_08390 [Aurantiacibacter sp. MUD11]|uniref:hypothetical protein n=1 Tax=Aurantiacibacter sp. MUD11 TaxID=3003265 RepID=UPI0022AAA02B|nr:hypothetical protein [Aurantiacibacter sp. MUD11]WAT16958.1 hypothetical protein OZN62_08390 [Aurantiacibacter sp. MUD11]
MSPTLRFTTCSLAALAVAALPVAVYAEEAAQLVDINGMYASDAERALYGRGFVHTGNNSNSMGYTYSYWWHEDDDDCVRVEEYNGRVEMIVDASDQDCGHHQGNAGAAVAVVAGAAILGALFSHRDNHHDDDQHSEDSDYERDFDRGYTDGLHNAAYHNRSRSEGYSAGYSAGVDEREANLRHHSRRGGYHPAVSINDLQGARAAGAMDEMGRRGFNQVDNFTSGNTRYSIQWNNDTRQCVQMTIADGHIYDIRDIGQHPNCR